MLTRISVVHYIVSGQVSCGLMKATNFLRSRLRFRSKPPSGAQFEVVDQAHNTFVVGEARSVGASFQSHQGRPTSKWSHYLDVYETYFSPVGISDESSDLSTNLIEIGVAEGGSLEVWHEYFGPKCRVVGIDVEPKIEGKLADGISVLIGSQSDEGVLEAAISVLGGSVDIVVDDGSHRGRDQIATFEYLWPRLRDGGIYIVEDLHTAYWWQFGGGPGRRGTFIEYAKLLIDDMHLWYHRRPRTKLAQDICRTVESIAFHDSIVAIKKSSRSNPTRVDFGTRHL